MRARVRGQLFGADDEKLHVASRGRDLLCAVEEEIQAALREIARRHEADERRLLCDAERGARRAAKLGSARQRVPRAMTGVENRRALERDAEMPV